MAGKSPVVASVEQKAALRALAGSRDRGEADRARAVLLTLSGWTPLLERPVADRPNWTLARLIGEIEVREGLTISKSRLSKVLRKKSSAGAVRDTP